MENESPSADQVRIKRTYGIVAICFIVVAIIDMVNYKNMIKLSSSLLMAIGWVMMYIYFPTQSKSRRLLIVSIFVVALGLVLARIFTRS